MPSQESLLTYLILGCALRVYRTLGPGLLESVYQNCLEIELHNQGLSFQREKRLGVRYGGREFRDAYRVDFVVEDLVVIEVKSVLRWDPVFEARVLTCLRLSGLRVGLLLNFNTLRFRDGIHRLVLDGPEGGPGTSSMILS